MSLSERLPGLNYAVITGVILRRTGLFSTLKGIPVVHLLVENSIENDYGRSGNSTHEIRVDIWGNTARNLDSSLKVGTGILAEGRLASREIEDSTGGVRLQNVLRARRVEILTRERERKG